MTALTNPIACPSSAKITLVATVPFYVGGDPLPMSIHIPNGTTAQVYYTCSTAADVNAGNADWVDSGNGAKVGPFIFQTPGPLSALKIVSAAGGTVNIARQRP